MNIVLYGTPMCVRCKTAQQMLEKRNIKYRYVSLNVTVTPKYLITMLPILEIDGKKYKGSESLVKIKSLG